MHELALAQNIVDTIAEKVTSEFEKIISVNIEMGAFSGVVADSLDFGLKTIMADKNNPDVKVNIVEIPTIAQCECGHRYELNEIFESCSQCNSFSRKLIAGMDVVIQSVELEED